MTVPKSKLLTISKAILATAQIKNDCPKQEVNQQVNVNINNNHYKEEKVKYGDDEDMSGVEIVPIKTKTREIENVESEPETQEEKVNPEVFMLLIEIIQNNPLIINKYIVAEQNKFKDLIKLLTTADSVDIEINEDIDCGCTLSKFLYIDKIYVHKGNTTFNLIYELPEVVQILDKYKISTKMIY